MKRFTFIALAMCITSCSSKVHRYSSNAGSYKYSVTKTNFDKPPIVVGNISNFETKVPLKTTGAIKIANKVMTNTDINGNFSFSLQEGEYTFTALGIPYEIYDTKPIKLRMGDSLNIRFWLKFYSKPLVD